MFDVASPGTRAEDASCSIRRRVTRPRSSRSSASRRMCGKRTWRVKRRGRAVGGRVVVADVPLREAAVDGGGCCCCRGAREEHEDIREVRNAGGAGSVLVDMGLKSTFFFGAEKIPGWILDPFPYNGHRMRRCSTWR